MVDASGWLASVRVNIDRDQWDGHTTAATENARRSHESLLAARSCTDAQPGPVPIHDAMTASSSRHADCLHRSSGHEPSGLRCVLR